MNRRKKIRLKVEKFVKQVQAKKQPKKPPYICKADRAAMTQDTPNSAPNESKNQAEAE
jgi:hypothetical protein